MRLGDIAQQVDLQPLTPQLKDAERADVCFCHASDHLSEVLANAPAGSVLITLHRDMFVLAVALLKRAAAVIFPLGIRPDPAVIERAVKEGVPMFSSEESVFTLAGKLYALGLRGNHAPT
jgi:hypothetical protein